MLPPDIQNYILRATGATATTGIDIVQTLWEGYGKLFRVGLSGHERSSVIVKHVLWPELQQKKKSRKGASDRSHQRKVRSYQVEMQWYEKWASHCSPTCRIPRYLGGEKVNGGILLILEDLDAAGYPQRIRRASVGDAKLCLEWLAHFHAQFMGERPEGLWKVGTY